MSLRPLQPLHTLQPLHALRPPVHAPPLLVMPRRTAQEIAVNITVNIQAFSAAVFKTMVSTREATKAMQKAFADMEKLNGRF